MDEAVLDNTINIQVDEFEGKTREELIDIIKKQQDIISQQESKLTHSSKIPDLLNEEGFAEVALADIDHARRAGENLCLIYMDANKFKEINDKFGRVVGDKVIIVIGVQLFESKRASDKAGHLSGDEFVVLALSTNKGGAEIISERLRLNIDEVLAEYADESQYPTLSFGIAQMGELPVYREPKPGDKNQDRTVVGVTNVDVADFENISNRQLYEGLVKVAEYRMKKDKTTNGEGR